MSPHFGNSFVYSPTTPGFNPAHAGPYSTVTRGSHGENARGYTTMDYGMPNQLRGQSMPSPPVSIPYGMPNQLAGHPMPSPPVPELYGLSNHPSGQPMLSPPVSAGYGPGRGWERGRSGSWSPLPPMPVASQGQYPFPQQYSPLNAGRSDFFVEVGGIDGRGELEDAQEPGEDTQETPCPTGCEIAPPHFADADEDAKPRPQMRSRTTRLTRRGTEPTLATKVAEPHQPRGSVEQKYRKRLNDAFQELLEVLPPQPRQDRAQKPLSKAELLDLAAQRIRVLERERASLEQDWQALRDKMEKVEEQYLRMVEGAGRDVPADKKEGK